MSDKKAVNLRTVAEAVGLAPCSVSAILNNTPAAQVIPQTTKERVFRAAAELNYRPNLWARSLRTKRTRMVAAVAHDFGHASVARVVAGLQNKLQQNGYLLALGDPGFAEEHVSAQFRQRGIEGVVAIDASVPGKVDLPVASVMIEYLMSEPLSKSAHSWLSTLGEAAAETIIQQIEQENTSRRTKVDAKLPAAYFKLPSVMLGSAQVRESA